MHALFYTQVQVCKCVHVEVLRASLPRDARLGNFHIRRGSSLPAEDRYFGYDGWAR